MLAKLTLGICLLTVAASAQTGIVRSAGQPIPGATVTITQGEKKIVTSTDENGRYEVSELGPGPYTIAIHTFGFKDTRRQLEPGNSAPVEWALELQPRVAAGPRPAFLPGARPGAVVNQSSQVDAQIDAAMLAAPGSHTGGR